MLWSIFKAWLRWRKDWDSLCDHCGKVNLFTALFYPRLPNDCAYRQTFRLWENGKD